jgi:hypothetical protein
MSVTCECCVLSRRGLCDGPIPRPEESYRVCVCVCVSVSVRSMNSQSGQINKEIKKERYWSAVSLT